MCLSGGLVGVGCLCSWLVGGWVVAIWLLFCEAVSVGWLFVRLRFVVIDLWLLLIVLWFDVLTF